MSESSGGGESERKPAEFTISMSDQDRAMHAEGLDGVAEVASALATALRERNDKAALVHLTMLVLSYRPVSILLDEVLVGVILARLRGAMAQPAPAAAAPPDPEPDHTPAPAAAPPAPEPAPV